jgi:hypothetical protein
MFKTALLDFSALLIILSQVIRDARCSVRNIEVRKLPKPPREIRIALMFQMVFNTSHVEVEGVISLFNNNGYLLMSTEHK